ncbi:MAG TPA: iron ABC transporter permease [Acidimicrobiia bacterium]|nr:iron ABC transporter permease [Acidimicrobiia bacterium]
MSGKPTTETGRRGAFALLVALVVLAVIASLGLGAVVIPPSEVAAAVARRFGLAWGSEPSATAVSVLWNIRLPRALLAAVTGAGLAVAGAALQGLFRNRLAEPHLLGIAPGAALGGVLGASVGGTSGAVAGGTIAGMLTALILKRLSRSRSSEPSRFVLTGLALGLAITAWVGFVVFTGDRTRIPPMEFWLLGNLAGTTWPTLGTTTVLVSLGIAGLLAGGHSLDLLTLGEADARRLGLDVGLTLTVLLLAVGAITGAAVGASGVIVFVGLVSPHLARGVVGAGHHRLLAGSALVGALVVMSADILGRTLASPREIPVGLITAAVGGPFFLWLIRDPEFTE